jgi:hypothetical protein
MKKNEIVVPVNLPGIAKNTYLASDRGYIYRVFGDMVKRIYGHVDVNGYKTLCLKREDGKFLLRREARVIAACFLGMPFDSQDGYIPHHIHNTLLNRAKNRLAGLEVMTKRMHVQHHVGQKIASKIGNRIVKRYPSIREAASDLGCSVSSILAQLNGKARRIKGYTFERIN